MEEIKFELKNLDAQAVLKEYTDGLINNFKVNNMNVPFPDDMTLFFAELIQKGFELGYVIGEKDSLETILKNITLKFPLDS